MVARTLGDPPKLRNDVPAAIRNIKRFSTGHRGVGRLHVYSQYGPLTQLLVPRSAGVIT
jgi:hypothetical protein